ncbi:MAG: TlpA disulfide reductase family protein, partial [Bacteroidota bacterium]
DSFTITGNFTNVTDSTMFYLTNSDSGIKIDSALLLNGKLSMKGKLSETPEFLILQASLGKEHLGKFLLMGNEDVNLSGDKDDFPYHIKTSGSVYQQEEDKLNDLVKDLRQERHEMVMDYFSSSDSIKESKEGDLIKNMKRIDSITDKITIEFIGENINTYAALNQLSFYKDRIDIDTVKQLYAKINDDMKKTKYAELVKVYIDNKKLEEGDEYYDFEAFNTEEKQVKLSELRKKYTLIEFTSRFCGPCRQALPELKKINREYGENLSIVSFSTDRKKEDWIDLVKVDSASWPVLWDGKGRYSEIQVRYGVSGVPSFVVIGPDNKIVKKWTGYGGATIESILKEVINL